MYLTNSHNMKIKYRVNDNEIIMINIICKSNCYN